jgi:undecaprenyl-diphosphatase
MPLFQVFVLAVVQGITEFLPVSSSAHLALAPWILGWPDQGLTFDIALHLGTLLAVLGYFFRTWVQIVAHGFGLRWGADPELEKNRALLWLLALGTIPVAVFGYIFKEQAENVWRENHILIGGMLIAVGLVMWAAESAGKRSKQMGEVRLKDAFGIGAAQALAIVPGTSRSGITMAAGLFRDLDRPAAARFSFLLATPAIAGAAVKAALDLAKHGGIAPDMRLAFTLGVVVSAITGAAVIGLFLKYLQHGTLRFFIYYRIIFGIIVIALAIFVRRPAG